MISYWKCKEGFNEINQWKSGCWVKVSDPTAEDLSLLQERFDLVVHRELLESTEGEELLEILRSDTFRKELRHFSGNDYRDLGKIVAEV